MEGLMDGVLPAEARTFQQIYHEADRLQRLVNDLQELSRIEAGAFQLNRQPLLLTDLVARIADRLSPQFEEKQMLFAAVSLGLGAKRAAPAEFRPEN